MATEGKVWSLKVNEDRIEKVQVVPTEFKIGSYRALDLFRLNKITILAVSYSSFSDPVIDSFLALIPSNIPRIIVQPILNPLKWILWSKLIAKNKDHYTIRGDVPSAIDVFGMENKYAGYVFLIDAKGMIQWKAAGPATANETEELVKKIKVLAAK